MGQRRAFSRKTDTTQSQRLDSRSFKVAQGSGDILPATVPNRIEYTIAQSSQSLRGLACSKPTRCRLRLVMPYVTSSLARPVLISTR